MYNAHNCSNCVHKNHFGSKITSPKERYIHTSRWPQTKSTNHHTAHSGFRIHAFYVGI